ncbi:hypothetical protein [uncultured Pontibacter sp.]|uniref:hypothetical protein n=1 Tax=uncultured Pontibacter sp. TaxID=453356 RepID=UPI002616DBE3|nr:hypothetical protein [uncultured Pontibacter sp.]
MTITINSELVQPLHAAAKKFGIKVNPIEAEIDGQYQVELPAGWSGSHWFEFGLQAGLDFQFKSSLIIND